MTGKLFSIGIGPGDPELLTLKAKRILEEAQVVAIPQGDNGILTAKGIVSQVVDLSHKQELLIKMPMSKDEKIISKAHQEGADAIIAYLKKGVNVAFITLGCPTVYATCIYVHKLVLKAGYQAELVPGVPSFCAVAARLNISLCEKAEPLIILPGSYKEAAAFLDKPGNKVLMKSASEIERVYKELDARKLLDHAAMVERCGLPGEKVVPNLAKEKCLDDKASYFSIILVKERKLEQ
jgi:precorrin-2/cobalt-factor-2 C20-methyltransferase